MSQLNVLSTENVTTYKKFKLDDGNLYMDNEKVGIETFGAGKNIIIKDNIIDICQNVDLSNMNVVNYVQIGENTFLYGDGIRKSVLTGNLDICGSLTTNQFSAVNQNYGADNSFENIYLANIGTFINMDTITISSEFIDASSSSASINILIANTLDISDTSEINGILDVSTIFFHSGIDATNINICGDVIFNEDISFNHDVFINGNVHISNNIDICNNAIIKCDISVEHITVYGDLIINGTLNTVENEFGTDTILGENAIFEGIQILNIDLSGTTTLTFKDVSYIDASNSFLKNVTDISVQNLELSNTIRVKENITVDGYFNFRNYIGNYSSISGEIILSNHVDISNSGSGPALNIYHDVDDDMVLFKNKDGTVFKIDASGNSDFYKNVDVSSLIIENNTNIEGNVFIHQNLDISNNLVIEGTIYNLQKIDISNNVDIYGNVDISDDYRTNPVAGNKNYFNLDIDGSGLEINIHTTQIDTSNSFRTITTYSYTDNSLDVSNISLITYSEDISGSSNFSDTITIIDFSGSHTEIQIGTTTISAESFTDICSNISIESTITNTENRYQIDICNQDNNNNNSYFHLYFNISTTSNPTIDENDTRKITTYSSDISNITLDDYNEEGGYINTTSYAYNTQIIIKEQQAGATIDISAGYRTIALDSFSDICANISIESTITNTENRYKIDICNQDNDGNKYHLSFTTSRESGPIIDDNCFNTLTTYEYSNEFHSNADISINSTIDNSYCFSGLGTMPMSGIIIWSGSELPDDGWVYCDGSYGTPDLRGRFIMGSTNDETININGENATYNIDQSGGFQRVTLQEEEMPAHSHSVETSDTSDANATNHSHTIEATTETADTGNMQGGNHSHNLEDKVGSNYSGGEGQDFRVDYYQGDEARKGNYSRGVDSNNQSHSHSINIQHEHSINNCETYNHTHNMNDFGGSGSHENLPPYYVLSFIMRIR